MKCIEIFSLVIFACQERAVVASSTSKSLLNWIQACSAPSLIHAPAEISAIHAPFYSRSALSCVHDGRVATVMDYIDLRASKFCRWCKQLVMSSVISYYLDREIIMVGREYADGSPAIQCPSVCGK